jgi:hypothetical protein
MDVSGRLHGPADLLLRKHCAGKLVSASLGTIEERKISCCYQESNPDSKVVQALA